MILYQPSVYYTMATFPDVSRSVPMHKAYQDLEFAEQHAEQDKAEFLADWERLSGGVEELKIDPSTVTVKYSQIEVIFKS